MAKSNKFGTFGGVFTPSILTILGVIMYLRLPMIVGEAGLLTTIGIIVIAHIISVTTGLSVSSIATDKKVEAGGTYYMISRSLGLPIGGTLGLALFVGLSFSVSLYLIGFSESFLNYWGFDTSINNIRITGTIVLLAVTTLTFISTSLALKTQYFIMAAIVLSLLSIFMGSHSLEPAEALTGISSSAVSAMVLFGIFFPAVTGFEAGVSMSGDLKDPKRSIPVGSILAIVVGFVVYIGFAIFLYYTVSAEALASDANILLKISWIPQLVVAGIWGATLSSALGSILGAPRILQATSTDRITPRFFGRGYGKANEPRNALMLTFLIAEAGTLIGELDIIARVVSIFFITTYGFLNLSAAFERWTSSDFRPEFKVPGWISLTGALACTLVMIQLDFVAMLGAVLILGLLFLYLKRKQLTLESGDAWSGVWASLVKTGLQRLKKEKIHTRNWRPNIVMFSGSEHARSYLADMGRSIAGNLGILSAFELVETPDKDLTKAQSVVARADDTVEYFSYRFPCRDIYSGMDEVARVYGFSGIEPNTILMGWSRAPKNKEHFAKALRGFYRSGFNNVFVDYHTEKKYGSQKSIDIWWSGRDANLSFGLALVRNITASSLWKQATVRVLIVDTSGEHQESIYKEARAILSNARLEASVRVVASKGSRKELVMAESADTDLVILGMDAATVSHVDRHYDELNDLLDGLGSTLVISSSDYFESYDIVPKTEARPADDAHSLVTQLPSLEPSRFPEIAVNIQKIHQNGEKLQSLLYEKALQRTFSDQQQILRDLQAVLAFAMKEEKEVRKLKESVKRARAMDRLKNEVSFKLSQLFLDKVSEAFVPQQLEALQEAVNYYRKKLEADFRAYPRYLTIRYFKEDFAGAAAPTKWVALYKSYKQFLHWTVGYPVAHRLRFRELAGYFQWGSRLAFLNSYLAKYSDSVFEFYNDCRSVINAVNRVFDEPDAKQGELLARESGKLNDLLEKHSEVAQLFKARLLLENTRNAERMSNAMEELFPMKNTWKRSATQKYRSSKNSAIDELMESFASDLKTLLNKVIMEQEINRVKNRIGGIHGELLTTFEQTINSRIIRKIDKFLSGKSVAADEKTFDPEADWELELRESMDFKTERFLEMASEMPDTLEVLKVRTSANRLRSESIEIPVSKMAEYYLKTRLITVLEEDHEKAVDQVKRALYTMREGQSLLRFKLDNAGDEEPAAVEEMMSEFSKQVVLGKSDIESTVSEFVASARRYLNEAFEPLSSHKIEESAGDFGYGLKSLHGRRLAGLLTTARTALAKWTSAVISRLLYVRSEGVLFARKLSNDRPVTSLPGRMLDLKQLVCPSPEVMQTLPGYYISLFNGRSSIGKDFWVVREREEEAFKTALVRYKAGYHGGILIIGERNEGKTAFARHAVGRHASDKHFYSLFPPLQGTINEDEFLRCLQRATGLSGSVSEIMTQLPYGSIISVNDLELFWERSADGLRIVQMLGNLIDDFGSRCLFLVNVNPHAFKLINELTGFYQKFIEIINLEPLDAELLKEVVMKRHKSSGFGVAYGSGAANFSEVELARLFNRYFDYSLGNPGTALNGWLANIATVGEEKLLVQMPQKPSLGFLRDLNDEWVMALSQFVFHKRLDEAKLVRITGRDYDDARKLLLALVRSGVVVEKAARVYMVDPYVLPFLVKSFKERGLL